MVPAPEEGVQVKACADTQSAAVPGPLVQSSTKAFLNGLGFGVAATISKAGLGVQRLATAQLMRQRERKARAAEDRTQPVTSAVVLRARESVSCSAKPQNCRRVVVLGAPRVGKTAILRRFLREGFDEKYEPTREDFHRKVYHIRGESYQIDILDAAGERDFPAKRRLSILTGDIFLLVFSVDDRSSFDEVRSLRSEISAAKAALQRSEARVHVPVVVCANKSDLPEDGRSVSRSECLQEFSEGCALFETSARDGKNLEEAFAALAESGGLPPETGPSRHRKLSIRSYHALLRAARQRGADGPCGALHPLARRPSFSTDLRLALASHANQKQKQGSQGCRIQ